MLFKKSKVGFSSDIIKMADEIVESYCRANSTGFEEISELERQVLAVYCFGVSEGVRQGKYENISNNDVERGIIDLFEQVFKYSRKQSQDFFELIVDSLQSDNGENTYSIIIHRGLDGYFLCMENKQSKAVDAVCDMISILQRQN